MRISPLGKANSSRGFTLVELLIVVTIIALITALALPGISRYFRVSMNSVTREIASIIRETYNATMMTGRTHRLVIDVDKRQYWVESGPPSFLLHTKESLEKEEYRSRWFSSKKGKAPPTFSIESTITGKKQTLPGELQFKSVKTQGNQEAVTTGQATIHFFPNGFTEQAIIYLEDQAGYEVSLVLTALVGKTQVVNHHISPEEAFRVQ